MNPNEPQKPVNENGAEPSAGLSTVPVWLIVVFGGLFYWCQLYLDGHAGGFSKEVYAPYDSPEAVMAANPQSEGDKMVTIGREVFTKTCSVCHQPNGLGKEGTAPPLVGSEWVLASSADRIVHIPLYGLTGPITVKGVQWNLTMTPLGDNLTDEQIAAALTYVRTKLGDNHGSPVNPELVKAARAEAHRGPETADELLRIPLQ
ncbi:MAG TPA: cytochrome c [Candidatus Baltobacteraceae bacterium]|jgi:mono/diheme cytochrome c family protein|nr:cytochrome c [Candidatus Baltobacteraceae bacterium]